MIYAYASFETIAVDLPCEMRHFSKICYIHLNEDIVCNATDRINFLLPESVNFSDIKGIRSYESHNFLRTTLPTEAFEVFPNLNELTFQTSSISVISPNDFNCASALNKLEIPFNYIEKIPTRVFSTAANLTLLDLSVNSIYSIEDFGFDGLTKLKTLWLKHNQLTTISRYALAHLPSLEILHLSYNSIEVIEDGALDLPKLSCLGLRVNKLKVFSDGVFKLTPELRTLWVDRNQIQYLNDALDPLQNIIDLDLASNEITDLNLLKLARFPHLLFVNLKCSGFNLDSVNISDAETNTTTTTTKSILKWLDLSENGMGSGIIFEKLKIFPNLEKVLLRNNSLTTMDLDAISTAGLNKLSIIGIYGNDLDQEWLEQTTRNLSMYVEDRKWDGWVIVVRPVDEEKEQFVVS